LGTINEAVSPQKAFSAVEEILRPGHPLKGSPSVHLDALRGFAAFSVLLNHWRDALFVDYSSLSHHNPLIAIAYLIAGLGHAWVIVFFVMSGYLVGGSVLRSVNSDRWSWRSYLLARGTRLYMVLIPALLLGGALDWSGMHLAGSQILYSGHSGMHALTANVHATLTLPILFGNMLFLQTSSLPSVLHHSVPTFGSNGPLWSLCNEFWYYIAFPIAVLLFTEGRSWRARFVCVLSLIFWAILLGTDIVLLGVPWLMGVAIAYLPAVPAQKRGVRRMVVASSLVLLAGGLTLDKKLNSLSGDLILGVVVSILIWVILHCATDPVTHAYQRMARRAGHSSYTLYLVHLPLLIFLKAFLHLPRSVPGWNSCLVSVGLLIPILIYAQVIYALFEKHTDRLRNWLKPYVLGRSTV